MEISDASKLLGALGHKSRLAIYRLLVEAGKHGINAGAIGKKLGMAPATLSFHLSRLNRMGLINARQQSRFIYYSVDFGVMDNLVSFLTRNCCQGQPCLPKSAAITKPTAARKKSSGK